MYALVLQRLDTLEREIQSLKSLILQLLQSNSQQVVATKPVRTFSSLRGAWAGVDISEEDIEDAKIKIPDNL